MSFDQEFQNRAEEFKSLLSQMSKDADPDVLVVALKEFICDSIIDAGHGDPELINTIVLSCIEEMMQMVRTVWDADSEESDICNECRAKSEPDKN